MALPRASKAEDLTGRVKKAVDGPSGRRDGEAAQVVTAIALPFKTVRPAGVDKFDSAKTYFDRARKLGFPAAGGSASYMLRAEFTTHDSSGRTLIGTYIDTWVSDSQWRREAILGRSRLLRTRNGDKRYLLAEGPDEQLMRTVLKEMEPIVATDDFVDSDWRIRREDLDGVSTVRVASGLEADGVLGPQARAFWFDEKGQLLKTHADGLETVRTEFSDFNGMQVARRVDVFDAGKLTVRIDVKELAPTQAVNPQMFVLEGHEWVPQATDELR
jgi:hypothetical protein